MAKIQNLETEFNALRDQADAAGTQARASETQLSNLQSEMAQALIDLQAARTAQANAEDQTATLKDQLAELAEVKQGAQSLEQQLATALAALLSAENSVEDVQNQLEQALAAKLAAEQLADVRLNESIERQLLLQEAQDALAEKSELADKTSSELLEAERQTALLNQQVTELRKQLGELQSILEISEEADAASKAQLQNLGNRLNAALARAASEQKKRRELEEAERLRLEAERDRLASTAEDLAKYKSEFFGRLREVLSGKEGVKVVGDRFVFSSEVLFPPGGATLSFEGEQEITKVGSLLQTVMNDIPDGIDWVIRVDGHTDDTPLSGFGVFKDNWELSQARALSVVKFMISELGMPASRLAANGFGEHQPVNFDDTDEARAQNRRIELKLTER